MRSSGSQADSIKLTLRGAVPDGWAERAVAGLGGVLSRRGISGSMRVRISAASCLGGPILVQANATRGATPVRAQVVGTPGTAAGLAADRLERQLAGEKTAPRRWPDPARPALSMPTESRPIARHKACALLNGSAYEAISALNAMDYDAHLFTDAETGLDAVVYRAGPLGVRLARQLSLGPPASRLAGLTVSPHPAAHLGEDEAVAHLCRYGLPFLFFSDPADRRGRLLYRRYDGDLTLVAPRLDS
ncbi:hypothetical protein D5S18_18400 [Nocardia panacis]|uniref:Sigma 54 modulation/S30EA ribosomal protein C-terminal domain-containing protein n=1 Tax=Nocardia panacis TaxID=2340916 RepID=A0A3A4KIA5_9NOCA|nr:sigma 54 modulation/S30EA ribosomal C-terminal domain-containing protein [Nocardia panacis]RJO74125.1 hypothetical protein D5S18_18400 [Nocardia panacis]